MALFSHLHIYMQYIYALLSIVIFTLGLLFGRKYRVIRRSQATDEMQDIIDDVKDTLTPTRARVISPRKLAEERAFSKELGDN